MNNRLGTLSLLSLVAACDSRADDDYQGKALLHLEGRVVIADPNAPDDLVPALLFPGPHGDLVMDVTAQGDFPNNFSLEVFAPPSKEALFTHDEQPVVPEGIQLGLAYITAVSRGHPAKFVMAGLVEELSISDLPACESSDPQCDRVERWCVDESKQDCRIVGLACDEETGFDCPPVVSSGNPAIQINNDQNSDAFAGLSENHLILWTDKGLSKDTVFAHLLGLKEDVAPGYALIEVEGSKQEANDKGDPNAVEEDVETEETQREDPLDPDCIGEDCVQLFIDEALIRYNAKHGTHYRDPDDLGFEDSADEQEEAVEVEIEYFALEIAMENGVDIAEFVGTKVIHDANTKLRIRIAPDVEPWAL